MEIIYLGHSSFKIKTRSATVVTDPYDAKMVGLKYSPGEADIVTVSHDHADHNQSQQVSGVKKVIEGPGEYEIMGVSILGFAAFHDDKKGVERGKNTIYVIEADGLRLAHLGDLGHKLSEELVEDLGDIDILMIPTGGYYTISPSIATGVVQDIEPSIVLPMHYQMPGLNQESFASLSPVEDFLKESGLASERLPKLSVKKEELDPNTSKVVVLEKR